MLIFTYKTFSSTILAPIWISIAVAGDTASSKYSFILTIKSKATFLDSKQREEKKKEKKSECWWEVNFTGYKLGILKLFAISKE